MLDRTNRSVFGALLERTSKMSAGSRLKAAIITTVIVGTMMVGGYLVKSELIEGMGVVHAAPAPAPQAVPVTVS